MTDNLHVLGEVGTELAVKRREFMKRVIDSRGWNDFAMRDDDIVISTWAKSGTTWTQQIVGQLIFGGAPGLYYTPQHSPWPDFRLRTDGREIARGADPSAISEDTSAD